MTHTVFVEFIVGTGAVIDGPERSKQNSDAFTVQYDERPWFMLLDCDTAEANLLRPGLQCELLIGIRSNDSHAIIGVKSPDATKFTATSELTPFAD